MGSLVGCRLWGRTELDTTEATQQQAALSLLLHMDFLYLRQQGATLWLWCTGFLCSGFCHCVAQVLGCEGSVVAAHRL